MGFIADLSRYDPLEAVDQYPDGVILNIEDPEFAAKRDRATAKHIPWGTYSWVYPGQGAQAAQRAHDAGVGPLGAWLDYEQQGVSPADLQQALARGDELGIKLGVYTYLYILDSVAGVLGSHPLWLAYYPDPNDGSYRAGSSDTARARGAVLHQFTSSNGTRDLNTVVDAERWSAWTGEGDDDVLTEADKQELAQWENDTRTTILGVLVGDQPAGTKGVLAQWENDTRAILLSAIKGDHEELAAAIVAKLPAAGGGGITKADVEAALRSVLHSA